LKQLGENDDNWERTYDDRLPVSFIDHVKEFNNEGSFSYSTIVGKVGSQKLIEYYLNYNGMINENEIFREICGS
jgi:hypothetical protein